MGVDALSSLFDRVREALAPRYDVQREIARGGMGIVYLARDTQLNRPVAIKILKPELANARAARWFLRESQALADLSHPNIVPVHDSGEKKGLFFYVMDYLTGETLVNRIRQGPLKSVEFHRLASDTLKGLEYAHQKKWIHRDIKPANIFLQDGRALIGDFGIARSEDGATSSSDSEGPAGTIGYMSPEQRVGISVTAKADIYSVGVVLYEVGTGRRWPEFEDPAKGDWSGVPRPVRRALRRALALDPGERPDAATMRMKLRAAREKRWTWRTAGAIGLAGAIIGPILYILFHRPPREPPSDLAILPFESADSPNAVGRRLARYAGLRLEPFRRLEIQPLMATYSIVDGPPPGRLTSSKVKRINAGRYVEGELTMGGASGVLHLAARDSNSRLVQAVLVEGDTNRLVEWGNAAADAIIHSVFPQFERAYLDLGVAGGSSDQQAVDEFIKGQDAYHRDAYAQAATYFRRAFDRDPHFYIAAWHLALAHRAARQPFEADLRRLAGVSKDSLPEHYRVLVQAQLEPDLVRRFQLYQWSIDHFPDVDYGTILYADDLFHLGPLIGISLDSALVMWESATQKSDHFDQAPAYDHLIWGNLRLGRAAEARQALGARRAISKTSTGEGKKEGAIRTEFFRLAYNERFRPTVAAVIRLTMLSNPDTVVMKGLSQYVRVGLMMDIPWSLVELGRILVKKGGSREATAQGYEARALASMQLGQVRSAFADFDSAAALFASDETELQRVEWRLLPPALGLPEADPAEAAWARQRLEAFASDSLRSARALWVLAVDAQALGDSSRLARYHARLTNLARSSPAALRLETLLDAVAQGDRGQIDRALVLSQPLLAGNVSIPSPDPFARALLYLHRGEWLAATKRAEEADRTLLWYENSDVVGWPSGAAQESEVDAVMSAYARFRRGVLGVQSGRGKEGCALLRRVGELWANADPSMAPLVSEARSEIGKCP